MTSNFDVKMDEYLPLRDVVFKTLRQAILKGELEPGERLMEIQLAERLRRQQDSDPGGDPEAGAGGPGPYDPPEGSRGGQDL